MSLESLIASTLAAPPAMKWPAEHGWYETINAGRSHRYHRDAFLDQDTRTSSPRLVPVRSDTLVALTPVCAPEAWWHALDGHPGKSVIPAFMHRGRFLVGPELREGGPVCPTCLWMRLAQGFPHPEVFLSLLAGAVHVASAASDDRFASLEPGWTDGDRQRFADGYLCAYTLFDGSLQKDWHEVCPPPGDHPHHHVRPELLHLAGGATRIWACSSPPKASRVERPLHDSLVGPILSTVAADVERDEPPGIVGMVTITGHLGRYTTWSPDVSGSGLTFDQEAARWASIGEAVERYCGNAVPQTLTIASAHELERDGCPYLPVSVLQSWSQAQVTAPDWPFVAADPELPIHWVSAQPATGQAPTLFVPAELVYLNYTRFTRHRPLLPVTLAGIAAHRSRYEAETAAVLELIERDATMVWWHGRVPGQQLVDLPASLFAELTDRVPREIEQWWVLLPAAAPVAVVGACLYDPRDQVLVVGFAARSDLSQALRKASAEAWQLRRLGRQLLRPDSTLWQEIDRGRLPIPVVPFRADRSYRHAFRSDFGDMQQLAYNLQYYLDPSTLPGALAWLRRQEAQSFDVAAAAVATGGADPITALLDCGMPVYSVDVTTPDMGARGFTVVRALCPSLVGNTATAFVPRTHPRLLDACRTTGAPLYRAPLPHA